MKTSNLKKRRTNTMKMKQITNWAMYFMSVLMPAVVILILNLPLYASETDNRIESATENSFVFKTYLKDDDIKVESKDGIVTLAGSVTDESHKSLAQETVAGLPEVKRVDNRLVVENRAQDPDAWLSTKVKTSLLFHKNVSSLHTDVDVREGIAILRGEAESEAQKELTTQYVKEVEGVKDVKNEMVVSNNSKKPNESLGETIDDASITAQVKTTLLFHKATSAINTKVETNNGVVTLKGKARNNAEKDLVSKLVEDIHGVKNVVNKMTIEQSKND